MASNALSASKGKTSRRPLLLAAAFGVLSAVLILAYLKTAGSKNSTSVATAPAVFALRDIPERTVIKDGMVEVRQIPVDARHNLAMQDKNAVIGQITRVPIQAGEQVLSSKIADQVRDVGFSASVPEGKRAVAVGVTEVIASGGHISPGDYVDVIGLFEVYAPTDANGNPTGSGPRDTAGKDQGDKPKVYTAVTLLQNIQVLAVAQNDDASLQPGSEKKSNGKPDQAKSVTLAVTPEQAEKLTLAENIGELRLSLRPFGDTEERKVTPAVNSLSQLVGN